MMVSEVTQFFALICLSMNACHFRWKQNMVKVHGLVLYIEMSYHFQEVIRLFHIPRVLR